MLDVLLNAAVNWIQKNPDHLACMAQKAFNSVKRSLGSDVRCNRTGTMTVTCPQCGRQYAWENGVYRTQVKGRTLRCDCGIEFSCP